jgi:hypothetical protein
MHEDLPSIGAICASTRKEKHSRAVLAWAVAVALGVTFVLLVAPSSQQEAPAPRPTPWSAPPQEVAPFAPGVGVVEESLSRVQDVPGAVLSESLAYGRPVPSKPLPGQRTPPCKRGEREIRGGCWHGPIENEKPPCGDEMFDYEGECYFASGPVLRGPASEEP